MTTRRWALALAFVVLARTSIAGRRLPREDQDRLGRRGDRACERHRSAKVGDVIYQSDTLRTGVGGKIGVTLKDDTRVGLGPSSEVRVERFVYAPALGRLGMVLRVTRGVAAYVSGQIAKLAPDAVRLETPSAIIGVRGTSLAVKVGD